MKTYDKFNYAWRTCANGLAFGVFGMSCIVYSALVFPLIRLSSADEETMRKRVRSTIHRYLRLFVRTISALGVISYELHGHEKLLRPGQLITANHPSLIDVLLLLSLMPDIDVDCIVKESLLQTPVLRWPMLWARYIPGTNPQKLVADCACSLRAGRSLIIFPEGTRSTPGQPLALRRGAARIALAAECDIVMVSITCKPTAFTKTDRWYRVPPQRPHWCLVVADPVRPAGIVKTDSHPAAGRRLTQQFLEYFNSHVQTTASGDLPAAATFCDMLPQNISDHEPDSRTSLPMNP